MLQLIFEKQEEHYPGRTLVPVNFFLLPYRDSMATKGARLSTVDRTVMRAEITAISDCNVAARRPNIDQRPRLTIRSRQI